MAGTSSEVVIGGPRASKKQNTNSRNNQLIIQHSSANKVESMEDMLIQIFLRLPVISLILFKSVCKRWYNIITSSDFILRRSQVPNIDPTSGLIIQRKTISITYDFAAFDTRIPTNRILRKASFPFGFDHDNRRDIEILQCCNGLLLCYMNPNMLYVYNPFTNQFKMLPQSKCLKPIACLCGIKMIFDPTKSPHYKVIFVASIQDGSEDDAFVQIRIYSSEKCDWSIYHGQLPLGLFNGFRDGVYWNDSIYWINMNAGLLINLDVVNDLYLASVPTPGDLRAGKLPFTHELFESRGSLLFASGCPEAGLLIVYEMKNGDSDWFLKYLINVPNITLVIPKDWDLDRSDKRICVRCIVLEEREEDSFLVMELYGKVVKYKMVSKTLHELSGVEAIPDCISIPDHPYLSCFPFIASFAGV